MIAMQVTILGRPFVGVGGVRFFCIKFLLFWKKQPGERAAAIRSKFLGRSFSEDWFQIQRKKTTLHMYLDIHLRIYVDNRWYRYWFVFLMGPRRETYGETRHVWWVISTCWWFRNPALPRDVSKSVRERYTTNQVVQYSGHKLYISATYAKSHPAVEVSVCWK